MPLQSLAALRREAGLWGFERALRRRGFGLIAGADEAGRGAYAGPLVAAAVVLPAGKRGRVPGLNDSKLLTPAAREEVYAEVVARALSWTTCEVPCTDIDAYGLHVSNLAALRRVVTALAVAPDYVLTDGFPVRGLGPPALAMWRGDQVAACVAAASVVAKVTRDRLMVAMHAEFPAYNFARHKGYATPEHRAALRAYGPCRQHRLSFAGVGDDGTVVVDEPDVLVGEVL